MPTHHRFGINLTGGGSRGSYQAGALLALAELLRDEGKLKGQTSPIDNLCGVSAGAINSVYIAAGVSDLYASAQKLTDLWSKLTPNKVYKTDPISLGRNSVRWIRDLSFGPLFKTKLARSLLDTAPLWKLISDGVSFDHVSREIADGHLDGLACSAYSYAQIKTLTFLQSKKPVSWQKSRRISQATHIRTEHVVASCSIPILFPSIEIHGESFGDGSFRNTSPISPLIHMGSKKILAIGVRGPTESEDREPMPNPGVAKIAGAILNALFFDTFDIDLERVGHLNEIVTALNKDVETARSDYTKIDVKVIRPSRDISAIAAEKVDGLPLTVSYMLSGLGSPKETAELASYILFEPRFTQALIELGYQDVKDQKAEISEWLNA
jgi:NTE family protein